MDILISTEIIKKAGLNKNEQLVLRYLCGVQLRPDEQKKAASARRYGRRKIFLDAMDKILEVLEDQRAG